MFFEKSQPFSYYMLYNDLRQLEMWSDLWSVTFNASKTEVLTNTSNPSLHPPVRFCNQALNETTSHKHLGLIFHRSLTWHLDISALHHRAMSIINALKKIKNFLPRYSLLVLHCAYVLPIVHYGDIISDNCTTTDSNLLESIQTAAAKIILVFSRLQEKRLQEVNQEKIKTAFHRVQIELGLQLGWGTNRAIKSSHEIFMHHFSF